MISINELRYVNSWNNRCPYPGIEYAKVATERLKASFEDFKKYYYNKKYSMILSNGEQVNLEIKSKNICHMLGVDYKNLMSDYFTDFRNNVLGINGKVNSFTLLSELINNMDAVLNYDNNGGSKVLNYYRLMIKNAIFEKLSDFSQFNFGVLNFDKEKYYSNVTFNSTKFLYVQSNEAICPYFMMGILEEENDNTEVDRSEFDKPPYAVETLFAPNSPGEMFKNQEVAIPTQIEIDNGNTLTKKIATAEEKLALLNQYKLIVSTFNIPNNVNINGDYEAILASESSKRLTKKL